LESLFDLAEPIEDWTDDDLAGMLRHQLGQPMEPGGFSIREMLASPDTSVESLQALKRLAKVRRAQAEASVPPDLWRVIYFAAIAAAARAGHRISDLGAADLDAGYRWTLAKPWLAPDLRTLVEAAHS
jgi:hypothetical protein